MNDIKISVDLRPSFGAPRDQGPRPTCLAFAASDAHAGAREGWAPLSCEFAFYHAQRRAGLSANSGAVLPAMLDALREDGQPEEKGWPYLRSTPTDVASWSPPHDVGTLFCRNGIVSSHSVDDVMQALDQGCPVIILVTLSRAFYQRHEQGVVDPVPGEQPEIHRRHAIIAVGHGMVDGQRAVLVRNSWGPRWGDGGYGWLTERFLAPRIFSAATLLEEIGVSSHSATA